MDSSTRVSQEKFSKGFQLDSHQEYTLKLINIEKSSLDTIRTLHQTIKTLRTALYKSKSELSLLKIQVHDEESFANTIEVLALENHILKDKFSKTQLGKDIETKLLNKILSEIDKKTESNEVSETNGKETVEKKEEIMEESNDNTETDLSLESNEPDTNSKDTTSNEVSEVTQNSNQQVENMTTASQTNLHEENSIREEDEETESLKESERDQSDSLTIEQNDNRNLESEESEDVDEVEFIFTTDDTVKLDQDQLVKIEETDIYPPVKPAITHSVFVETDISKCGVLEEDADNASKSNLVSNIRRNTSPNPLGYRPYLHREGIPPNKIFGQKPSVKFAKDLANVRPIYNENVMAERQDGETQTEISAVPVYWKSESYLNHSKISQNFTTLPSKFSIPTEPKKYPSRKYSLRLCEKTQEARRVLLSDINFTSMVPELSRSVDQLCQQIPSSSSELYKNYPGAFSYMKNPDMSCFSQTPCDCSSRQTSWEYSNYSIPSTPSAIDITEPKKRPLTMRPSCSSLDTNWTKQKQSWTSTANISPSLYRRSKSVPFNSNLHPFSEFCSSQTSNLNTPQSASRYFQKHRRMHRKHVAFSGSVPDLRSSMDTEESTDSLIDESEEYLRRSIDSMFIEGGPSEGPRFVSRHRRNSAPADAIHGCLRSASGSLYPFTPKVPTDLKPNNLVKVISPHGRVLGGKVRYVGPLPGQEETFVGVALTTDDGNCDGSYQSRRFFDCEANKGLFVSFKKVVLAWNTSG